MQVSTDTISLGRAYQNLLEGTGLRPGWYNHTDLYLPSYSTDLANPYSAGGVVGTTNYSGWNSPVSVWFACVLIMFSQHFCFNRVPVVVGKQSTGVTKARTATTRV